MRAGLRFKFKHVAPPPQGRGLRLGSALVLGFALLQSPLALAQSSSAPTSTAKTSPTAWKMGLSGVNAKNLEQEASLVHMRLDLRSQFSLSETLLLRLEPAANLATGSTQSYAGELRPENRVFLTEASAEWTAHEFFQTRAGALNMAPVHTRLLLGEQTFPALRLQAGDQSWQLRAESAIPTSVALTTNQGDKEPLPQFQSLSLLWSNQESDGLGQEVLLGGFSYSQLPSSVANESGLKGNRVVRLTDLDVRFASSFRGWEARWRSGFALGSRWRLFARLEALRNLESTESLGQSQLASARVVYRWDRRTDLLVGAESFRLGPDSVPAAYTDTSFSGTNRVGYAVEAGLRFGARKTLLRLKGGESQVLFENPPQSRENFILMQLETAYAQF